MNFSLFSRRSTRVLCVTALLLAYVMPGVAPAYQLEGERWPGGRQILLDLDLGSPATPLTDRSLSWDDVAVAAIDLWNPYLGEGVQFAAGPATTPVAAHDGRNSVCFGSTIYGDAFDNDTLAVTINFSDDNGFKTESDVIFNSAQPFDSYRGPLRYRGLTLIPDLRRVALHEFGHVLGLEHVAQLTASIMTPVIRDVDTLQADDIAGAQTIYGSQQPVPRLTSAPQVETFVGIAFTYQITATYSPTVFRAETLPPGLSLNEATGLISGVPTTQGTFAVPLTLYNAVGAGPAFLQIVVKPRVRPPSIKGSELITNGKVGSVLSYQVAVDGAPSASPPTAYNATGLPPGVRINPASGLIQGIPEAPGNFLATLEVTNIAGSDSEPLLIAVSLNSACTILHDFEAEGGRVPGNGVVQGIDGNLYGTTEQGGLYDRGTLYRLTPDGQYTVLHHFQDTEGGRGGQLLQAPDGSFYGVLRGAGPIVVYRMTPDGTLTILHRFPFPDSGSSGYYRVYPSVTLTPTAGGFYGTVVYSGALALGEVFLLGYDGAYATVHAFGPEGPRWPCQPLVQAPDGSLYGVAGALEVKAYLFRLAPGNLLTVVQEFPGPLNAVSGLVAGPDGAIYGSYLGGGIFRYTPETGLAYLAKFSPVAPASSYSYGIEISPGQFGADGSLYGTVGAGRAYGLNEGAVFRLRMDGRLEVLHFFDADSGSYPVERLIQAADGSLYGVARSGGENGGGTVFRVSLPVPYVPLPTPGVSVAATAEALLASGQSGEFTVTLSEPQPMDTIIRYKVAGSAVNGKDYTALGGTKKIKAGKTRKTIKVQPQGNLGGLPKKKVKLTLLPDPAYTVLTTGKTQVVIRAER